MSFVKVNKLEKSYGKSKVFENINFTIEKGEFITLLGPSGCGKTTLLRCISGLEDINSGEIYIEDKDISRLSPKDRNISMVFQSYALFPNMTVRENIGFGLKMKKVPKEEAESKIAKMLELVELSGKDKAYPHELSGGQQQRVALARALVMEPKILLLDEPLSALDAKIRKSLRMQIREIQKKLNITTIFVTHDQEEALIISDRIFIMDKGHIAQMGTSKEIYTSPESKFVAEFIGNYNIFTKEEIIKLANRGLQGEIFAVRPETISMCDEAIDEDGENILYFSGSIKDNVVLGNVIRYYVQVMEKNVTVDLLNRKENYFDNGKEVTLFVTIKECKKIK
ncbi:ABC transporter ATP-binding protein [Clostridium sp. 19966]|uniref:ABC transporter ATP-binding protein n=1 Tax=Clostridium sp. 19966 TaxID=2768166 RepID=UPI0028DD6192|nr:ABC transporter ATP-binding protein [Clostridium sp. 19966]MDT8715992.1 ABC transporter ATP-binding protein [Clostridium sp. 19966]